jgi:hypothetical protein
MINEQSKAGAAAEDASFGSDSPYVVATTRRKLLTSLEQRIAYGCEFERVQVGMNEQEHQHGSTPLQNL